MLPLFTAHGHGAVGLAGMAAVVKPAMARETEWKSTKPPASFRLFHFPQTVFPDTGGVDQAAAERQGCT